MWGKVTDGTLDRDGQIVDPDWAAEKLMDWFHDLGAPVRNMHSGTYPPAGKGLDLSIEDDGAYVRAAIVEPTAIKLLDLGVYKDFSVGIAEAPLYSDPSAPGGRLGKAGDPDGWINEISLVDTGSNKNAHLTIVKRAKRTEPPELVMEIIGYVGEEGTLTKSLRSKVQKAEWSTAYVNDLPDSSFAFVEPGGEKDEEGKTTPRSLRHFPYKDKDGTLDPPHVRNALARLEGDQSPHAEAARAKIEAAAESLGIGGDDKEMTTKMSETATASKAAKGDIPEGHQSCDSCSGSGTIKGELPCPKCEGKGHHPIEGKAKKGKKAAKAEGSVAISPPGQTGVMHPGGSGTAMDRTDPADRGTLKGHDADDDVRDAIGDADDAITEAGHAQAVDDATEPGGDDDDKAAKVKAGKKTKVKVKGKLPPFLQDKDGNGDGDGDGDKGAPAVNTASAGGGGSTDVMPKGKGKAKKSAGGETPYSVVRMHDLLCPCYSVKAKKSAYGSVTPEVFDATSIREAVTRLSRKSAAADEIADAALALQAATGLVHLAPKTFADLARAAHKGWLGSDPGLPNMRPGLINPEQFRRGFLSGADGTVSHSTTVPSPALKPTINAEQFDRGPLTENETRPSLVGGSSVAKSATVVKGRTFYTNAAQSEHTTQMGQLHDWIANNFPGCCPMSGMEGRSNDSDGQIGRPAEMNAPLPPEGASLDGKDGATITATRDTSRANKSSGTDELDPEDTIRAEVKRRVKKATKRSDREVRRLKRVVKSMSAQPDARRMAVRSHPFSRPKGRGSDPVRLAKAKEAVALIQTRDSRNVDEGLEELRELGLSPRQFASLATAVATD